MAWSEIGLSIGVDKEQFCTKGSVVFFVNHPLKLGSFSSIQELGPRGTKVVHHSFQ